MKEQARPPPEGGQVPKTYENLRIDEGRMCMSFSEFVDKLFKFVVRLGEPAKPCKSLEKLNEAIDRFVNDYTRNDPYEALRKAERCMRYD